MSSDAHEAWNKAWEVVRQQEAEIAQLKEQVMDWSCKYHDKAVERDKLRADVKMLREALMRADGYFMSKDDQYLVSQALAATNYEEGK